MDIELENNSEYRNWLYDIKIKIKNSQIKATIKVNTELVELYWFIGKMIVDKQANSKWGTALIQQTSADLKNEFPDAEGFSRSNLYSMRKLYLFYNEFITFVHQAGGQIENNTNLPDKEKYTEIIHQFGGQLDNISFFDMLCHIPWRHHTHILEYVYFFRLYNILLCKVL